jgi:hypothetical protein
MAHTQNHTHRGPKRGGWGWNPSRVRPDAAAPGVVIVRLAGRKASVFATRAGRIAPSAFKGRHSQRTG